jgi:hypothetical protein
MFTCLIFINSLPDYLEKTNDPISIEEKSIHCLMYADDIVLLSKSSQGLQEKLNKLKDFCNDWCLNINISLFSILTQDLVCLCIFFIIL